MTTRAIIGRTVLVLLIGAAVPAQAQQDNPKREHQRRPHPTARPAERARAVNQPQRPERREPQARQSNRGDRRAVWQRYRARTWASEHRSWQQRGGYSGYRIPDRRYRVYFGPSHGFRVYSLPVVVYRGYPRFRYGGVWFSLLDPWPEYWPDNWYETDDVYIDYDREGYYLVNERHPEVRIAVNVDLR